MPPDDFSLIQQEVQRRQISRVCHLTQSRKLPHILLHDGIYSVEWLQKHNPDLLDKNDTQRLDGLLDHISCSIEYPNSWYLKQAAAREALFKNWVIILIRPNVLWRANNRFCVRNCGAYGGALAKEGYRAFLEMFQPNVEGAGGRIFSRRANLFACCPTDGQAEVMVQRQIERDMIYGVVVPDKKRAEDEIYRLQLIGVSSEVICGLQWLVAPDLFTDAWHNVVINGRRPKETEVACNDNNV